MSVKIDSRIKSYSVVQPGDTTQAPSNFISGEADRRLKLHTVQVPVASSLRWVSRPVIAEGNPAQVFQVNGPDHSFFVIVSYVKNGSPNTGYPFELLIAGEGPRALNALAKSLSLDMRSHDRLWLRTKLESIANTVGTPFTMTMPNGFMTEVRSEVAAFALLVLYQCEQLGAFSEDNLAVHPLVDARMSSRRPITTAEGTVSWSVDIKNDNTKDSFKMFMPELVLPDGSMRPYELWFSGDYPAQSFDGLAKCLSLDMQVNDVEWFGRKLKQLLSIEENRGEFWAQVPGSEKSRCYPSTVAYVATLILHRFHTLGLLDENGSTQSDNVVAILRDDTNPSHNVRKPLQGLDCAACGALGAVRMEGGCGTCSACQDSQCS